MIALYLLMAFVLVIAVSFGITAIVLVIGGGRRGR